MSCASQLACRELCRAGALLAQLSARRAHEARLEGHGPIARRLCGQMRDPSDDAILVFHLSRRAFRDRAGRLPVVVDEGGTGGQGSPRARAHRAGVGSEKLVFICLYVNLSPGSIRRPHGPRNRRSDRPLQWNIERGYELPAIIDELRLLDADVLYLQEIDWGCERSGSVGKRRARVDAALPAFQLQPPPRAFPDGARRHGRGDRAIAGPRVRDGGGVPRVPVFLAQRPQSGRGRARQRHPLAVRHRRGETRMGLVRMMTGASMMTQNLV